jgi:4-hydroxy-4-methyl-2-oxoglutarate aldolase
MMNALARLPVSTLCDVDKSLPVADPAIRPITGSARLCGPAYTAVATDEFLSTLWAINDAAPGDVLKRTAADSAESSSTVTCATAAVYRRSCRCGLAARCLTRGDRTRCPMWVVRSPSEGYR